jgi:hypothetical protein
VISGAVLFITKQFGLSAFPEELVVSMVLVGAAVGALSRGTLLLPAADLRYDSGRLVCSMVAQ